MLDPTNVPAVESDELLARYIFSDRHFSRENRRVKAGAFMPAPDGAISVTRHREATQDELWQVGQAIARLRDSTLYARADVLSATCASWQLSVKAAPIDGNPNHANVAGWPMQDKARRKLIAEEIALVAEFVPLPESEQ
jgi:hypothetical protein